MGRDKTALRLDGRTLVERCVAGLEECFGRTLVVREDDVPGLGPIGGLLTALRHAETEALFVVAGDMPFLDVGLIRGMCAGWEAVDAVVVRVGDRFEPLHALYQRRILPVVEEQIARRDYALQRLVGRLTLKTLSETDLSRYPDWQRSLLNVNTPADWERIGHGHET